MADIDTPQFDLPFRLDGDGVQPVEVEQDSNEEVWDSTETLLRTELGTIEENQDYGIVDPSFEEMPLDLNDAQAAISEWEPRFDVVLEEQPDALDALVSNIKVKGSARSDA